MLIGGIVVVAVVVGLLAVVARRRRSRDDVHSVELYHRSLLTLEEMQAHPQDAGSASGQNGKGDAAPRAGAFRASGSSTVRLTEPGRPVAPPSVPPPPVANPSEPLGFDDPGHEGAEGPEGPGGQGGPEPVPGTFMSGVKDRTMRSVNRRPRRLGAPVAAIAVVAALVAVLVVTGKHSSTSTRHNASGATPTTTAATPTTAASHPKNAPGAGRHPSTTTTTAPPPVSAPTSTSAQAATYQVSTPSYTLSFAATTGECWIQVTATATGSVLFSGLLSSGQSHSIAATGPMTVVAGAPDAFAATVDGAAVTLPPGYQAPFTLTFQTATS